MTGPAEVVRRVVAAVLVRDGRLLLCHRRDDAPWYAGVWDLPGGHVDPGETPEQALVRECREELSVDVLEIGDRRDVRIGDARLTVFRVNAWRGDPVNAEPREHRAIGWFALDQVRRLALSDSRLADLAEAVTAPLGRLPTWPA